MTDTYKDWHEFLPFTLYAYCTSICTSMGETSYSLIYGMEAVLPVEVEIPSIRILSQIELSKAEWARSRYEQLNMIDEKCMTITCHVQLPKVTKMPSVGKEHKDPKRASPMDRKHQNIP